MALSEADVLHIAKLANLALSPAEVSRLQQDLAAILAHVEQLSELDTTNVPPTSHLAVARLPLREDSRRPGLEPALATAEGPRITGSAFAVPKFVDD